MPNNFLDEYQRKTNPKSPVNNREQAQLNARDKNANYAVKQHNVNIQAKMTNTLLNLRPR